MLPVMKAGDIVVRALPSAYSSSFDELSKEMNDLTAMLKTTIEKT